MTRRALMISRLFYGASRTDVSVTLASVREAPSATFLFRLYFNNDITDASGHPVVPATKEPQNQFKSAEEAVALALNQELKVTEQNNDLVSLAIREDDFLTQQMLQ